MENGVILDGPGPIMSGTWSNPKTGDSFIVRDTFFENNQYVIQTTDGRILKYDNIQNYVKISDSSDPQLLTKNNITDSTNQQEEIPQEIQNLIEGPEDDMLPEDRQLINNSQRSVVTLGNINNSPIEKTEYSNDPIISKALTKCTKPELKIQVNWKKYPLKEIELLKDIMDIPEDEIVDWFLNHIDLDKIADDIKKSIISFIKQQSTPQKEIEPKKIKKTK